MPKTLDDEYIHRRDGAYRGWAKRRTREAIERMAEWLGKTPDSLTIWGEDYDLIDQADFSVKLYRGPDRRSTEDKI